MILLISPYHLHNLLDIKYDQLQKIFHLLSFYFFANVFHDINHAALNFQTTL